MVNACGDCRREKPTIPFSLRWDFHSLYWILSLNRLSQEWGQVQGRTPQPGRTFNLHAMPTGGNIGPSRGALAGVKSRGPHTAEVRATLAGMSFRGVPPFGTTRNLACPLFAERDSSLRSAALRGCDFFRTSIALQSQAPLSAVVRAAWGRGAGSAQSRVDRFFPTALTFKRSKVACGVLYPNNTVAKCITL